MQSEIQVTEMGPVAALLLFVVASFSLAPCWCRDPEPQRKLVCYYGSWSVYRWGAGKFDVEDISPHLCTHLVYSFVGLGADNQIRVLDPYNDLEENWGRGAFKRFNKLKKVNRHLKTLLAIGGWNEGSIKYSKMAADPRKRRVFVKSSAQFVLKHNFDGLDLDWEYPGSRGGKPQDKANFAQLCRELRAEFNKFGLLLTAAVSAGKSTIDVAYDVPALSQNLDFINVMTYDFHGSWEKQTGHNAPLFFHSSDTGNERYMNVDFAIHYWAEKGAFPEKLVLGMGFYGRTWTLDAPADTKVGAPASRPGDAGPYTGENGMIGYNELCWKQLTESSWTVVWDDYCLVPYTYSGKQWLSYDDLTSIELKSQYLVDLGLGGAMVWSIETDDFSGQCHDGPFPLLATIRDVLSGHVRITPPDLPHPEARNVMTADSARTAIVWFMARNSAIQPRRNTTLNTATKPRPSSEAFSATKPRPSSEVFSATKPRPSSEVYSATSSTAGEHMSNKNLCHLPGFVRDPRDCAVFHKCKLGPDGNWIINDFRCPPDTWFDVRHLSCNFKDQVYCQ